MNLLNDVFPKILAAAMDVLVEELPIINSATRKFEQDAKQKGDIVWVPYSQKRQASDVVPGHTAPDTADVRVDAVPIQLNYWKESPFTLNDRELRQIMDGVIPLQVQEAARAIRNEIAKSIWIQSLNSYQAVGTPGTTPFASDLVVASEARKLLNKSLAPMQNRYMLLNVDAEANASILPAFSQAQQSGSAETITEGRIGRKLGFDWMYDNAAPANIPNTLSTASGGVLAGAPTTVTITNPLLPTMNPQVKSVVTVTVPNGTTGGVKKGNLFKIAGDPNYYVVTDDANVSGTSLQINFKPTVKVPGAWVSGAAITWTANHQISLAMQQNAIGLVMAPFLGSEELNRQLGRLSQTFIDPITGIPLRLELEPEHKQVRWSLDALWGVNTLREEHLVRIMG